MMIRLLLEELHPDAFNVLKPLLAKAIEDGDLCLYTVDPVRLIEAEIEVLEKGRGLKGTPQHNIWYQKFLSKLRSRGRKPEERRQKALGHEADRIKREDGFKKKIPRSGAPGFVPHHDFSLGGMKISERAGGVLTRPSLHEKPRKALVRHFSKKRNQNLESAKALYDFLVGIHSAYTINTNRPLPEFHQKDIQSFIDVEWGSQFKDRFIKAHKKIATQAAQQKKNRVYRSGADYSRRRHDDVLEAMKVAFPDVAPAGKEEIPRSQWSKQRIAGVARKERKTRSGKARQLAGRTSKTNLRSRLMYLLERELSGTGERHTEEIALLEDAVKLAKSSLMEKAKKGTPQYDEWLRKYHLKRRKKRKPTKVIVTKQRPPEEVVPRQMQEGFLAELTRELLQLEESPNKAQAKRVVLAAAATFHSLEGISQNQRTELNDALRQIRKNIDEKGAETASQPLKIVRQIIAQAVKTAPHIGVREHPEQIEVQLAKEFRELPEELWEDDKYIAEQKINGARLVMHVSETGNRFTGRNKSRVTGLYAEKTDNLPDLRDLVAPSLAGTILDGEVVAKGAMETRAGKKAKQLGSTTGMLNVDSSKVSRGWADYVVFDILKYKGRDVRSLPWSERRQLLEQTVKQLHQLKEFHGQAEYIKLAKIVSQGKKHFYEEIVKEGGEGIMLKHVDHSYKAGSRESWIKVKRFTTHDVVISGTIPGKGRNIGKVGAFRISAYVDGVLREVGRVNIGTDEFRDEVSANPDLFMGKIIEVRAQEWTRDKKLQHPRLEYDPRFETPHSAFRGDKTEADAKIAWADIVAQGKAGDLGKALVQAVKSKAFRSNGAEHHIRDKKIWQYASDEAISSLGSIDHPNFYRLAFKRYRNMGGRIGKELV